MAKVPGDRIKLMNMLDEAMHKNTQFQEDWSPCDLYAMVVALDQNCVLKSTNYHVSKAVWVSTVSKAVGVNTDHRRDFP